MKAEFRLRLDAGIGQADEHGAGGIAVAAADLHRLVGLAQAADLFQPGVDIAARIVPDHHDAFLRQVAGGFHHPCLGAARDAQPARQRAQHDKLGQTAAQTVGQAGGKGGLAGGGVGFGRGCCGHGGRSPEKGPSLIAKQVGFGRRGGG